MKDIRLDLLNKNSRFRYLGLDFELIEDSGKKDGMILVKDLSNNHVTQLHFTTKVIPL